MQPTPIRFQILELLAQIHLVCGVAGTVLYSQGMAVGV
ncbi:hypothetical protein AmaxDRAFT_2432 [Limnospira maxima CS-328]|uniref:Uncharacterized protein n=1 Tax=Limnospira maxima CS-328 TaxID=513049 RepID=B5W0Z2_LIMMA|nr:hypothetical protein AmaxDRAFT_2432 [Limnospira maxima CS-328]UWU47142.1 hypothetical protein APLC1_1890 [Arthrospira platensis C1]